MPGIETSEESRAMSGFPKQFVWWEQLAVEQRKWTRKEPCPPATRQFLVPSELAGSRLRVPASATTPECEGK